MGQLAWHTPQQNNKRGPVSARQERKGFITAYRLKSTAEGNQSRKSRQEPGGANRNRDLGGSCLLTFFHALLSLLAYNTGPHAWGGTTHKLFSELHKYTMAHLCPYSYTWTHTCTHTISVRKKVRVNKHSNNHQSTECLCMRYLPIPATNTLILSPYPSMHWKYFPSGNFPENLGRPGFPFAFAWLLGSGVLFVSDFP